MSGMLVAVTGGTGLVGSHSVAALVRAGHRVRLLVRDPSAVEGVLAPLGVPADAVEVAVADVTDAPAVTRAPLAAGVTGRPVAESMADTVRWLHATGRLTDKQAGAALSGTPVAELTGGSR